MGVSNRGCGIDEKNIFRQTGGRLWEQLTDSRRTTIDFTNEGHLFGGKKRLKVNKIEQSSIERLIIYSATSKNAILWKGGK